MILQNLNVAYNWTPLFSVPRLGKLIRAASVEEILRYCEEFFPGEPPEYFFDRNPENFPAILDMYRSVRNYYYYFC